uniref:Glycosyl hydrolase family 38 C-terminal domain-containing protein n=1 Tax=Acrobeloides nanus TaxID=290746 RepID=A0A914DWY4_9BILA
MEQVLNNAMQTISQYVKNNTATFPQQIICRRANESDCDLTREKKQERSTINEVDFDPTGYLKTFNGLNYSISNGLIQLDFDPTGYLNTFHDLKSGKAYSLKQEFAYYHGHDNANNSQASGAYIFRPQEQSSYKFLGSINLEITQRNRMR